MHPFPALRRFLACRKGTVALIQLAGFVLVAGILSLGVDAGSLYLGKQQLQGAIDVAALKAVTDRDNAATIVLDTLSSNIDTGTLTGAPTIETGRFPPTGMDLTAAAALPVEDRFEAGAASPNALRVTAQATEELYLARLFFGETTTVGASAVAYNRPLVQVAASNGGITVDSDQSAALNGLLSGLFGASVSLSVASSQALVDADVSLADFLGALAAEIGISADDYQAVLEANVTFTEVVDALIAAVAGDPALAGVAATLTAALTEIRNDVGGTAPYALEDIITLDADDPDSATGARINLYDLVRANGEVVRILGGGPVEIALPILGGTVRVWTTPVEPTRFSAVGEVGVTVRTALSRTYVVIEPIALFSLLGKQTQVRFPVLIEMAPGTAQVTSLDCPGPVSAGATAGVHAEVAAATATLADIDTSQLGSVLGPAIDPGVLVDLLGVVRVTATGSTSVAAAAEDLTFTAPFTLANAQSVEPGGTFTGLTSTLIGSMTLDIDFLGLPLPLGLVTGPLNGILNAVASKADALLELLFGAMGVEAGAMQVAVPYVRCSNPKLVQ